MGIKYEVNGEVLDEIQAWRYGQYLITRDELRGPCTVAHVAYVSDSNPVTFAISYVGKWFDLPDAVQGARAHAQLYGKLPTDIGDAIRAADTATGTIVPAATVTAQELRERA